MDNRSDFVEDLYDDMLRDLKARIASGEASPQDRKLIDSIAQRHGVDVDTDMPGNPLTGSDDDFDVPFSMDDLTVGAEE